MKDKIKIAIDAMKFFKEKLHNGIYGEYVGNFDTAISALEKQIPKKPINTWGRYWGTAKGGYCPICNSMVNSREHQYCKKCGQALDWSDTE